MPYLAVPQAAFIRSFLDGERELRLAERRSFMGALDPLVSTHAAILKSFADTAAGRNLPPGRAPSAVFWLIDRRGEFVGSVSLRDQLVTDELRILVGHIGYTIRPSARRQGYGKQILRLALPKAHAMGIDPALLTCDNTNVASRKIIESCGGIYESEVPQKIGLPPKLRFWVPTGSA